MTPVGKRLKTARVAAGLKQAELGAECGISQAQVSRFELGQVIPGEPEIRLMARALGIDPAVLAHGASGAVRDVGSFGAGESEDDVRRRALLAAGIGIGSAAALPPTPATASTPPSDWDRALYASGPSGAAPSAVSAAQLNAGLGSVAQHLATARYEEAEKDLPRLIVTAKTAAAPGGKRGAELLTRAWVLASAVRVKERHPDAWSTSSWAVEAARRSQHPLALAMAARSQYICLRQHGQHRQAQMVAQAAAFDLEGEEYARPVLGHLLLESAYGAAQAGRATDAVDLWERGRALARKGPAVAIWPDYPGPLTREQVERYGLCIHHALGDTRRALGHMETLNASAVRVPHTAARIRHDSAKLRRDVGDMAGALRLLQDLAVDTPQDARRTSVRGMVSGMVRTCPALPGLRPFAASIGAV
ncbi:helix-turn-helix domain-containing protein [Streptomyces nigrescens]|uniref:helix-turn-helix domain-containing protein n=1 Tax=Streptomyces nigrescens TaxID=1920 RepID=UPI0036F8E0AA